MSGISVLGVVARPAAPNRAHASVQALELRALGELVAGPAKPYVAVLGGTKVSDKIEVVEALLSRVDVLAIGGGMANTFLAAGSRRTSVQASRVESDTAPQRADSTGV